MNTKHTASRRYLAALAVAALIFVAGCDPVADFVEKYYPGFTPIPYGISGAGYPNGIVGRVPNVTKRGGIPIVGLNADLVITFPNLHCCWIGDRTGWQPIGSFDACPKVKVDAQLLASLKAVKVGDNLSVDDEITVKAEISRDDLKNIRHIYRKDHCEKHDTDCYKEFVISALRADVMSITTIVRVSGAANVTIPAGTGSLSGSDYSEDAYKAAPNLIIGYTSVPAECGGLGTTATFGTNKQPSGLVSANDDYEAYVKADGPKIIPTPTPTPTPTKTDKPPETPTTNPH